MPHVPDYTGENSSRHSKLKGIVTAMFKSCYDEYTDTREKSAYQEEEEESVSDSFSRKRKRDIEEDDEDERSNAYKSFKQGPITITSTPNTSTDVIVISDGDMEESHDDLFSTSQTNSTTPTTGSSGKMTNTTTSSTKSSKAYAHLSTSTESVLPIRKRKRIRQISETETEPSPKNNKMDTTEDLWSTTDEDMIDEPKWKSFEYEWSRQMNNLQKILETTDRMPGSREIIEETKRMVENEYLNDLYTKDIQIDTEDSKDVAWWVQWQPMPHKIRIDNNQIKIDYLAMTRECQEALLLSPLLKFNEEE